ncbi:hypothetical protein V1264_009385 [Littorina saxatilis]|uniref:Uncharacterized protein n=1 Tax=Littorina saxatilis TaxID=31220 RepID=A0AAN9G1V5_9CAEN
MRQENYKVRTYLECVNPFWKLLLHLQSTCNTQFRIDCHCSKMMYLVVLALCLPAILAQYPPYTGGYGNPCYPFGPYSPFNPYYPNDPTNPSNAQCGQRNSPCSPGASRCCFALACQYSFANTYTCQTDMNIIAS